jgi:hypothetical protein
VTKHPAPGDRFEMKVLILGGYGVFVGLIVAYRGTLDPA